MQTRQYQLFVYGSLRSGFQSPAYRFIAKYFNLVGNATVSGSLYETGTYPVAVPDNSGRIIVGELYAIKFIDEFSFAIAQLDDYEGVYPEEGETAQYIRALTPIKTPKGPTEAWIYWYNGNTTGLTLIESGDLLEYKKKQ
jgi:gamma-glutamylcyclotransferase (GGCT)/AIG2-like uncharacterized protein YtfP